MQQDLPFHEAEAAYRDRRNTINLALAKVGCDLHLREFVGWIFNVTNGGAGGALKKTYRELSYSPLGLCCSSSKARATVSLALRLGLVRCSQERYSTGAQAPNSYQIDWDGVRGVLYGAGVSTEQPPVSTRQPPVSTRHLYPPSSAHANGLPTRARPSDSPLSSLLEFRTGPEGRAVADICSQIPELATAVHRKICPLPAKSLRYGAFAALKPEHLGNALVVLEWHRRQLSISKPVCGDSEAELLLSLATARYALHVPHEEVRKNRVAIFVATTRNIGRERFNVFPHVPKARGTLDVMLETFGDALLHSPEWPPQRIKEAAT